MIIFDPLYRIEVKSILRDPYFNDLDKRKLPAGNWDGELVLPSLPPRTPPPKMNEVKRLFEY